LHFVFFFDNFKKAMNKNIDSNQKPAEHFIAPVIMPDKKHAGDYRLLSMPESEPGPDPVFFGADLSHQEYVSFFVMNEERIMTISYEDLDKLGPNQTKFVHWYRDLPDDDRLQSARFSFLRNERSATNDQETICGLIMGLLKSPTVPDPELY
jgi:hypothetical protein